MFVPSVVDVVIVYVPVVVFGIAMWYVPSWSNVTSVPKLYVVLVPDGSVIVTVVVPVSAGSTFNTIVELFIACSLLVELASGVISSPVAVSLWNVTVAFCIVFVVTVPSCDSVYPFPAWSFALVFILYSVFATRLSNVGLSCQAVHAPSL